jgi:hypothetical protein
MPSDDASVELKDLGLQCPQLAAESSKTRAGHLREPAVGCIGDDFQQLLDTPASDRGNNPKLGETSADRIDDGSLLADEEMARAEASGSSVSRPSWSAQTACWVS